MRVSALRPVPRDAISHRRNAFSPVISAISVLRLALFALLLTVSASPHAQQARGVNPAEVDSRFDVIVQAKQLYHNCEEVTVFLGKIKR